VYVTLLGVAQDGVEGGAEGEGAGDTYIGEDD